MKKILVVDDEEKMRKMICDYLEAVGFETITAVDGVDAVSMFISGQPDLIIMDIMMPGIDGIDCTRRIRERSTVPIIMVTAKAEEADKLMGLEMGADDYILKPFSLKELAARIRSLLRRVEFSSSEKQSKEPENIINVDNICMDIQKMIVHRGSLKINLTSVQFNIVKLFMNNPGRVFTREQILTSFQEDIFEGYERTIDVHIKNIRKVLEEVPSNPNYIETVWGVGYRFTEGDNSET
ncbi:MAG: response regulator transcription factor [Spirochaetaceae bacterium]